MPNNSRATRKLPLLSAARASGSAAGALLADDVSGVGVANDPGIPPVVGLAALLLVGSAVLRGAEALAVTPKQISTYAAALTTVTIAELRQTLTDAQVLQVRGEYVPPGLNPEQRNTYREAVHRYKRSFGIPASQNVPQAILDDMADRIKDGASAYEAAREAAAPPEGDDVDDAPPPKRLQRPTRPRRLPRDEYDEYDE